MNPFPDCSMTESEPTAPLSLQSLLVSWNAHMLAITLLGYPMRRESNTSFAFSQCSAVASNLKCITFKCTSLQMSHIVLKGMLARYDETWCLLFKLFLPIVFNVSYCIKIGKKERKKEKN